MFDIIIECLLLADFGISAFIVSLVATLASGAYSYVQSQKAAEAQEQAGLQQQQAAQQAAKNVELENAEKIRRARVNKRRQLARLRAGMTAGSGLMFEGSLEDAYAETAGIMELGIQDEARRGVTQAQDMRTAGNLALWESRVQAFATRTEGATSLLSSVARSAGSAYYSGAFASSAPPAPASGGG